MDEIVTVEANKDSTTEGSLNPAQNGVISVSGVSKTYASGLQALKNINLDVRKGEIFALLGPNGAGKTTLISLICGIVRLGEGSVRVNGHDIVRDYRKTRAMIGLVPQELTVDAFVSPWTTASLSRSMFGKPSNPDHIEKILKDLSLWDKRNDNIIRLSGGMKRRVMIAKALAHEPDILFLDEPTAGVDVELRRDMWQLVHKLRETGVTIILTTHYIEEAEEMADRIGVIRHGELILVEQKNKLMRQLGKKRLTMHLQEPADQIPPGLEAYELELTQGGKELVYTFDRRAERTGITALLADLNRVGVRLSDLETKQSTLEEIFVDLIREKP